MKVLKTEQVEIEYDEQECPNPDLEGPCWVFRNGKTADGYGQIRVGGKKWYVHRYVYVLKVGPIPDGMVLDHRCRNRACCNPGHLRPVTNKANVTENVIGAHWQKESAKTHCPKGHPYDEANTRVYRGKRYCRECLNVSNRSRRRASKVAVE